MEDGVKALSKYRFETSLEDPEDAKYPIFLLISVKDYLTEKEVL